jgi:Tol biopolymer transport system component
MVGVITRSNCGILLLLILLLAGCVPAQPKPLDVTPTSGATVTRIPSATITPTATQTPTPTPTNTVTPTPSPTPPETIAGWMPVLGPDETEHAVATVHWSATGRSLVYALSPAGGGYLLDWFVYDLNSGATRPMRSPNYGFADAWRKVEMGYPRTVDPYSELLGFVSPEAQWVIYPNAGFPDVFTNPNYISVIFSDGQDRRRILGPIYRGVVGRAAWLEYETHLIFDYRYEDRAALYLTDLLRGRTVTLAELPSVDTEWRVSPDGEYLLIPRDGGSEFIPLRGKEAFQIQTPGGMSRPEWSGDGQAVYFWTGGENRIVSYSLADQSFHPFLVRRDLEPNSPIAPVHGMSFTISPDAKRIAFWWEGWIWIVEMK